MRVFVREEMLEVAVSVKGFAYCFFSYLMDGLSATLKIAFSVGFVYAVLCVM